MFCSNRGERGGCGRTFSIFLSEVLPRHSLRAPALWQWLVALLAGASVRAAHATLRVGLGLELFYRLRRRLRQRLDVLRTLLCGQQAPPPSSHSDPLLQTCGHLQTVFAGCACAPAEFQLHFQSSFLG